MGEVSDMMVEGVLCQECGVYIDDSEFESYGADGYPRFCYDCGGDPECNFAAKRPGMGTSKMARRRRRKRGRKKAE